MDLAHMILDLAEAKQKAASQANTCELNLLVQQRYPYYVRFQPIGSRVQILYNGMTFSVSKDTPKDFDEVIEFISKDVYDNVAYNITVDRQRNIQPHPLHRSLTLTITRGSKLLAWNKMFVDADIREVINRYSRPMRMLA